MPRTTRTHYWSVLGVLWLAGWSQSIGAQNLPEELIRYADVAFFNGDVLTVDTDRGDFTMARAVAVRDGRILAVGTSDRILRLVGPSTRKIDLKGKATFYGSLTVKNMMKSSGTLTIYYRPASPALTEPFWPMN